MLTVGLTGGIGSGKSTAARLFAARGAPVIDTDEIAHALSKPGAPATARIAALFGRQILQPDGALDRAKLRTRVFADATERKHLESILHPPIRQETLARLRAQNAPYSIVVVPLLIESGFDDLVDRVLVVDCSENLQIERAIARSGMTLAEIERIMAAQATRQERLQRAHDVIVNAGSMTELEQQVEQLHERYLTLANN